MIRRVLEHHLATGAPVAYWKDRKKAIGDEGLIRAVVVELDATHSVVKQGRGQKGGRYFRPEKKTDGVRVRSLRTGDDRVINRQQIVGSWAHHEALMQEKAEHKRLHRERNRYGR